MNENANVIIKFNYNSLNLNATFTCELEIKCLHSDVVYTCKSINELEQKLEHDEFFITNKHQIKRILIAEEQHPHLINFIATEEDVYSFFRTFKTSISSESFARTLFSNVDKIKSLYKDNEIGFDNISHHIGKTNIIVRAITAMLNNHEILELLVKKEKTTKMFLSRIIREVRKGSIGVGVDVIQRLSHHEAYFLSISSKFPKHFEKFKNLMHDLTTTTTSSSTSSSITTSTTTVSAKSGKSKKTKKRRKKEKYSSKHVKSSRASAEYQGNRMPLQVKFIEPRTKVSHLPEGAGSSLPTLQVIINNGEKIVDFASLDDLLNLGNNAEFKQHVNEVKGRLISPKLHEKLNVLVETSQQLYTLVTSLPVSNDLDDFVCQLFENDRKLETLFGSEYAPFHDIFTHITKVTIRPLIAVSLLKNIKCLKILVRTPQDVSCLVHLYNQYSVYNNLHRPSYRKTLLEHQAYLLEIAPLYKPFFQQLEYESMASTVVVPLPTYPTYSMYSPFLFPFVSSPGVPFQPPVPATVCFNPQLVPPSPIPPTTVVTPATNSQADQDRATGILAVINELEDMIKQTTAENESVATKASDLSTLKRSF